MRSRLLRAIAVAHVIVLAGGGGTYAADEPKTIPWRDSGPWKHVDGTGRHTTSHQLLLAERAKRVRASAAQAASQDVGEVAVIVDNGRIFTQPRPASPFDLNVPTALEWTPAGQDAFHVASAAATFDPAIGPALTLTDDDTEEVSLPFTFPFLGDSHQAIFVNTDGNVTLGAGDATTTPRDAARLVGGPPRIAALLNDLNPEDGGSIHASVRANEVVLTWQDVPEFGVANKNRFQLTLRDTGEAVFAYQAIDARFAVVGVAEGGDAGPVNELDLTADLPATREAGAIFEEFVSEIPVKRVSVLEAAREFYRTHPDQYDFLVLFEDTPVDTGGAFAFHLGLKNQTSGFGRARFDFSALAGSGGELESVLQMNRIGLYWPDEKKMVDPPIKKFRFFRPPGATLDGPPGADQTSRRARWFGTAKGDSGFYGSFTLGLNSAMSIMGQEAGHRWLAYPRFQRSTSPFPTAAFDLLGRSLSHWSFFHDVTVPPEQFAGDPRASSAEGNAIADLGPAAGRCASPDQTRFGTQRNELIDGYSALDQYLMGVRQADDVGPFWYVDDPTAVSSGASLEPLRAFDAQDDIVFCGKRVDLTVAKIQAVEGPRIPAAGDEIDTDARGRPASDVKTMAFVLLVDRDSPEPEAHAAAIAQVDTLRRTWQRYANGPATGGRGRFDTSLRPGTH